MLKNGTLPYVTTVTPERWRLGIGFILVLSASPPPFFPGDRPRSFHFGI
ncbi:MAG: hypothetical protein ACK58N_14495 [Synechocystis sp.]